MPKKYDLTVYGATGFTGVQAARAFADVSQRHGLKIAISGRNHEKLKSLAATLSRPVDILVAESTDKKALNHLTKQSKLVVNLAGPFAKYAPHLIASCVENRCNYIDITGEATFIGEMIELHHQQAQKSGVRIIPFCGFDSIPSDIGWYYMLREWRKRFLHSNEACQKISALFQIRGGFKGGTIATAIQLAKEGKAQVLSRNLTLLCDPNLPLPNAGADWIAPRKIKGLEGYGAPFFMAPINTRVVRRSQSLFAKDELPLTFSPSRDVLYEEGQYVKESVPAMSSAISTMLFALNIFSRSKILAAVVEKIAPKSGSGPSEENMNSGFAKVSYVATGERGSILQGKFRSEGDPGNRTTIKLLIQAALCLALDEERKKLPEASGVLTPAYAFRDVLIDRLIENGVQLSIDSPVVKLTAKTKPHGPTASD